MLGSYILLCIRTSSGHLPRSGFAESYDNLVLAFIKEHPYCSQYWLCQFTFPLIVYGGVPLLNILSSIFVCRLCDDSHSDLCDLTSISLIICILASFHVLLAIRMSSMEQCVFILFLPILFFI